MACAPRLHVKIHHCPVSIEDEAGIVTWGHLGYAPRGGAVVEVQQGEQHAETGVLERLGSRFGSPLALAISVPTLVLILGATATLTSYAALCRVGRDRARAALHTQSVRLKSRLDGAFKGGDHLLDRLKGHVVYARSDQAEALLSPLTDLSTDRAGLSWMSVSFADGTFVGTRRDDRGVLMGQLSRAGTQYDYALDAADGPRQLATKVTDYDPRKRPFFDRAAKAHARVWTEPYPFLPSLRTGITRAEPVFEGTALRAVITIDFDVSALSALLDAREFSSERTAVVTDGGSLLGGRGVPWPDPSTLSKQLALRVSEVSDPVLQAAFAARAGLLAHGARSLSIAGQPYHVDAMALTTLGSGGVTVLNAVAESELYADAAAQARRAALLTGAGTLTALLFALFVSLHVGRLRRARERVEGALARAENEARRLGSYELHERLGAGGMGEVYRARHVLLARDAALKLMKSEDAQGDPELRESFFEEARRLSSMRSIHTVSVYDFGLASDGRYYLAMELLHGLDLEALVREYGPQPPARVAAILAQVCDSLSEAHAAGLLHQDIKPANIYLCRQAEYLDLVKVLDFGISRLIEARTSRTSLVRAMGTPAFMSPEQILGESVGPAADLYAVGCVGYFLLTGALPFQASSLEALALLHVEGPIPELPPEVLSATPVSLRQLLVRCLAKRPENRPVSASALSEALRRIPFPPGQDFAAAGRETFWTDFETRYLRASQAALASKDAQTVEAPRVYTATRVR